MLHAAAVPPLVPLAIGNSDYRYANKLANPSNDDSDFAQVLRRLGLDMGGRFT